MNPSNPDKTTKIPDVQRWDIWRGYDPEASPSPDGEWVRWEDVANLIASLKLESPQQRRFSAKERKALVRATYYLQDPSDKFRKARKAIEKMLLEIGVSVNETAYLKGK